MQHQSSLEVLRRVGGPQYPMRNLSTAAGAIACEVIAMVLLSLAVGVAYHEFAYNGSHRIGEHAIAGLVVALFYALPFVVRKEYSIEAYISNDRGAWQILMSWSTAFVALGVLAFLTKTTADFSRGWVILFFISGYLMTLVLEAGVKSCVVGRLVSGSIPPRRVMAIGSEEQIKSFTERLASSASAAQKMAVRIVSVTTLPDDGATNYDQDLAKALDSAMLKARALQLDDVIILCSWNRPDVIDKCFNSFMLLPVAIHLDGGPVLDRFKQIKARRIGVATAVSLTELPLSPGAILTKRAFDFVVASFAFVISAPILVAIAVAIKLDTPGPVFFRQRRLGFNQLPFDILKFRSMTVMENSDVIKQAEVGDVRVTRVGRFIRKWNLDELPQLFNVLKGDMSLVGPRPHAVAHDRDFEKRVGSYPRRLNMKPGITGWAQVNGHRGATDTDDKLRARVEHDLHYVDNWSIALDMRILLMTMLSPRAFRNAV